jgi:hypothetical protein
MDVRIEWRPDPPKPPAPGAGDTRWSLVLAAGERRAGAALEELCARYWCAAYAYVRRVGSPPAVAQSTTAAFFNWLVRAELRDARPGEGRRFRDFLLARLHAAHADGWREVHGAGAATIQPPLPVEILEDRYLAEVHDSDPPAQAFTRSFSNVVVMRSFERLRAEAQARDRLAIHDGLAPFLRNEAGPEEIARAAAATGLTQAGAMFALRGLRQRLREIVAEEVADTLADPAAAALEVQGLPLPGLR